MTDYTPIEIATALSLYGYNIDAGTRAAKLYKHFDGACMEEDELIMYLQDHSGAFVATELPYPTAKVYVDHALACYGQEARDRCAMNASYS